MKFSIPVFALTALAASFVLGNEAETIQRLNTYNATVQSFTADVDVVLQRRAVVITSAGKSYYQKPKDFRMMTTQVRNNAQNSDFGSNDKYFWFWIRRISKDTMYYSTYENLMRTNLPDTLHPLWMMDTLGVGYIPAENVKIKTQGKYITVQETGISPQQKRVIKLYLIDPNRPAVSGVRLYDERGQILASSETETYFKTNMGAFLPQKTETRWYSEQVRITTTFKNPKVNARIDPKTFQLPKTNLKVVDIGTQRVELNENEE